MFSLYDTFNNKIISRHRTIEAVARADKRLQSGLKRRSPGSYLPTTIRGKNGENVGSDTNEKFHEILAEL